MTVNDVALTCGNPNIYLGTLDSETLHRWHADKGKLNSCCEISSEGDRQCIGIVWINLSRGYTENCATGGLQLLIIQRNGYIAFECIGSNSKCERCTHANNVTEFPSVVFEENTVVIIGPGSSVQRSNTDQVLATLMIVTNNYEYDETYKHSTLSVYILSLHKDNEFKAKCFWTAAEVSLTAPVTYGSWSPNGQQVATVHENGETWFWSVPTFSRHFVALSDQPIEGIAWNPFGTSFAFAAGNFISIERISNVKKSVPINDSKSTNQIKSFRHNGTEYGFMDTWFAHEGGVLCLSWDYRGEMIVSGGADCVVCGWNSAGKCLFKTQSFQSPILSIIRHPFHALYAVGLDGIVVLVDRGGNILATDASLNQPVDQLTFSQCGRYLGAARGSLGPQIMFIGCLTDGTEALRIRHIKPNTLSIEDISGDKLSELSLSGHIRFYKYFQRILGVALNYEFVIYELNYNTHHQIEHKVLFNAALDKVPLNLVVGVGAVCVYNGRSIHLATLSLESTTCLSVQCKEYTLIKPTLVLNQKQEKQLSFLEERPQLVTVHKQLVAIVNFVDLQTIEIWDFENYASDTPCCRCYRHCKPIIDVAVCGSCKTMRAILAFVDSTGDAFAKKIESEDAPVLISSSIYSISFSSRSRTLSSLSKSGDEITVTAIDAVFLEAYFQRQDMKIQTKQLSSMGIQFKLSSFDKDHLTIVDDSGGRCFLPKLINPHIYMIADYIESQNWSRALGIAKAGSSKFVWLYLGVSALHHRNLDVAEWSFFHLDDEKMLTTLAYLKQRGDSNTNLGVVAESLFLHIEGNTQKAIDLLETNKLYFFALNTLVKSCKWKEAFELAQRYKNSQNIDWRLNSDGGIDTVAPHYLLSSYLLCLRQKYLNKTGGVEYFHEYKHKLTQSNQPLNETDIFLRAKKHVQLEASFHM